MAEETMYAWTPILAGGEVKTVKGPGGVERNVVQSRNRIAVGEKVDKAMLLEGSMNPDADWDAYVESGAIRPYPFPEGLDASSTESPLDYLRRQLREAAEAEVSEEQQLLLAVGKGAVVSDADLAAQQPGDLKSSTAAANKTATEPVKK